MFAISEAFRLRVPLAAGFIAVTSLSIGQTANAQSTAPNEWTWVGGSSMANLPGIYGTQGIPAVANTPGGRISSASWTDSKGNFWLYGGTDGGESSYNDLWEYYPSTNEWVWMGGSSNLNQYAVYGSLGTPSAGNTPGSRSAPARWIDESGNVWLFGGVTFGGSIDFLGTTTSINNYPDDLWEFNPATKEWAWMSGSDTVPCDGCGLPSVYGTMGVPVAGNTPGSRPGAVNWTDSNGNFWLFGGYGFLSNDYEVLCNDLWEFNLSTKEWAWMGGSHTGNQPGVYGILETPAAGNIPGGRWGGSSWVDHSGNVWILGGLGLDANGTYGYLNDLWEFNPSTKEWAWMSGSSAVPYANDGQLGVYGTLGVPAAGNTPGWIDSESNLTWTDTNGNLWLLGEALWEFNPSTKEWAWMGESSTGYQTGIYGTL